MAIETKPEKRPETEKPKPLAFRDNPEVKKKIEAHKKANPDDVVYYTRLVQEHPERAIDTLIYRDQQRHESEMRLIEKQLPQARAFYNAQTPEAKAHIDADLAGVKPYYQDKAFVNAALREKDLAWADVVLISAMIAQRDSAVQLIARCRAAGKTIVNAALREKDRQARREFAMPVAAPNGTSPTPGADVSKVVPMPTTATPRPPRVAV